LTLGGLALLKSLRRDVCVKVAPRLINFLAILVAGVASFAINAVFFQSDRVICEPESNGAGVESNDKKLFEADVKTSIKDDLLEPGLLRFWFAEQLRKFGKNGGDPLRLVARQQLATPKPAKRLLFEIHVGKSLPVGVLHHKAAIQFLD
jgi:hypothetical protein